MNESHYVEHKQELTKSLEQEVVAFLNYGSGGRIIFGVDKNGIKKPKKSLNLINQDADN